MSVQAPPSTALRTIWTTAMDRYFIDLMLEQVGRGSRVDGHLFSKRAWRHMTLLFNEKFRLQYSRDHLKNRHKTLRRVYRVVKNLLDQSGFSWDETQHMVTADDHVWNNYTKAHPEARSYRTKSIPFYNDMCKIFKNSSAKTNPDNDVQGTKNGGMAGGLQSSTTSVADEDSIDDEQGLASSLDKNVDVSDQIDKQQLTMPSTSLLNPNEGMVDTLHEIVTVAKTSANGKEGNTSFSTEHAIDTLQSVPDTLDATSSSRSRTYWQPPMDSYFIELMLDQVHQGNQFDGTFRKHAWMHMTELFNAKFGFKYDMVVLKNRYKSLKRQYTAVKILLDQKGFVWDDTRQMVIADDHIWHDYIRVHPDAKQYITRPVPHFNDLCVIFKDVIVNEGYNDPAYNIDQQNEVLAIENGRASSVQQSLVMPISRGDPINAVQESSSHLCRDSSIFDHKNKRQFATPSTCQNSKKLRRNDDSVMDALPDATTVESSHLNGDMDIFDKQNKYQLINCQHSERLQRSSDEGMTIALREMAAIVASLSDKRIESNNSISMENAIHAVQAIPDIDDDLILDACDLLEDEKKAQTFLSLDVRLRKKWLMRKLRPE